MADFFDKIYKIDMMKIFTMKDVKLLKKIKCRRPSLCSVALGYVI